MASKDRVGRWAAPAGVLLAVATATYLALLSRRYAIAFLALLLAVIAAVYVGFALADGRRKAIVVESAGAAAFLALATLGLWWTLPALLATGYMGHGAWDVLHHPRVIDTRVRRWYVPLCLAYDVPLGLFILAWF